MSHATRHGPRPPTPREDLPQVWRSQNEKIAQQCDRLGEHDIARQLRECRQNWVLYCCHECGHHEYRMYRCHRRECQYCGHDRASKWRARLCYLASQARDVKHVTLTVRRARTIRAGLDHLRDSLRKWVRNSGIRDRLRGWAYTIEVKPKPDGWHVHAHMLADADYIPLPILWASWAHATGQRTASISIGRRRGERAARYCASYVSKGDGRTTLSDPQRAEYLDAMHHTRTVVVGGCWYRTKWPEDTTDTAAQTAACPDCGREGTIVPVFALPLWYGHATDEWIWAHCGNLPRSDPDPPHHVPRSTGGLKVSGITVAEMPPDIPIAIPDPYRDILTPANHPEPQQPEVTA